MIQAVPLAETPIVDQSPRCWRCNRKLAEFAARPWRVKCERCNAMNSSQPEYASP